jgi:hypothetical protein
MGAFDLKGGSNGWNYSDNTKEGYSEILEGTVVEVSNPQALDFQTRQPKFWPDGNPVRNFRLTVLKQDGEEVSWTFQGGKPKVSPNGAMNAIQACIAGLDPSGMAQRVSLEDILGKHVTIQTRAGSYNAGNPRPWWVKVHGDGDISKVRGVVDLSKEQAQPQAPQPAQAPVPPPQPMPSYPQQAMAAANGIPQPPQYYGEEVPF